MDIDIVLPWVDNEDPDWQAAFHKWLPANTEGLDVSEPRYRNWHLLRYWFRGVEQFAPWVRKIHFITNGQLPKWLNTQHPKLHIVKHSDILPVDALPCFSSHPLELNMHRIEGLAEHFVYFNDDIFLTNPVRPTDFFVNGLPVDMAVTTPRKERSDIIDDIIANDVALINSTCDKYRCMLNYPSKWFHYKYRGFLKMTLRSMQERRFYRFADLHTPQPYLKSTLCDVWNCFPQELQATTLHRFRSCQDVNQWLFRYWHLAEGRFTPADIFKKNVVFFKPEQELEKIVEVITKGCKPIVTINDSKFVTDFESLKRKLRHTFGSRLHVASTFEKQP